VLITLLSKMVSDQTDRAQSTQKAREWWKKNQGSVISSTLTVLGVVKTGLEGLPISGTAKTIIEGIEKALTRVQVRSSPSFSSIASEYLTILLDDSRKRKID
jgi:phosphoribosyl-dephospho-CoA transferase